MFLSDKADEDSQDAATAAWQRSRTALSSERKRCECEAHVDVRRSIDLFIEGRAIVLVVAFQRVLLCSPVRCCDMGVYYQIWRGHGFR